MMRTIVGALAAAGLFVTVACGQTDAGITTSVKSKLAADDMVKAYQVDVTTRDHVVTLAGDVETAGAHQQALRIARETEGVRDVIDQMRVRETAATTGSVDADRDVDVDVDVDDDTERGAARTAEAARRGADRSGDAIERGADRSEDAIERGARATGNAAKKVGEATVDGAKKVGGAVRDAVTDDNRDSDNDGK